MINKNYIYALVGASKDQSKYGNIVLQDLIANAYKVLPINPKEKEILGLKAYSSLKEVAEKIDVVIFVVPPEITLKVLAAVKELNIKKVWFQPGSESEAAIEFCRENQIECISQACIMVEKSEKKGGDNI